MGLLVIGSGKVCIMQPLRRWAAVRLNGGSISGGRHGSAVPVP